MKSSLANPSDTSQMNQADLLGLIVHSYNNFLAGMMGFAELALLQNEQDEVEQFLSQSLFSGNQAEYFGKSLLACVGRLQVKMENQPIINLLGTVLGARENIESSEVQSLPDSLLIHTNSDWFVDCLNELLDFLQHFSKHKQIELVASIQHQSILLELTASELSIDKVLIPLLFQPFYSSRVLQGGKGIGLAKAKGFFSQVGGQLDWLPEGGFSLLLPVAS